MPRYDLYHGDTLIRTYTADRMAAIYTQARHDFERWVWQQKQQGRRVSPLGFRLVPTPPVRKPFEIHEGWMKGAADD